MCPRSGFGGHRSGRDGLQVAASAVTLRERTRARAIALGLNAEWTTEGNAIDNLALSATVDYSQSAIAGGVFTMWAVAVSATIQPATFANWCPNVTTSKWLTAWRGRISKAPDANTDIRVGLAIHGAPTAPTGIKIGAGGLVSGVAVNSATTATSFTVATNTWYDFRCEYDGAGVMRVYVNNVFVGGGQAPSAQVTSCPTASALTTANGDRFELQALYAWCVAP